MNDRSEAVRFTLRAGGTMWVRRELVERLEPAQTGTIIGGAVEPNATVVYLTGGHGYTVAGSPDVAASRLGWSKEGSQG